jgi:hypothetical protein
MIVLFCEIFGLEPLLKAKVLAIAEEGKSPVTGAFFMGSFPRQPP